MDKILDSMHFGDLNIKELFKLYDYAVKVNHEKTLVLCEYIVNIIIDMKPGALLEMIQDK